MQMTMTNQRLCKSLTSPNDFFARALATSEESWRHRFSPSTAHRSEFNAGSSLTLKSEFEKPVRAAHSWALDHTWSIFTQRHCACRSDVWSGENCLRLHAWRLQDSGLCSKLSLRVNVAWSELSQNLRSAPRPLSTKTPFIKKKKKKNTRTPSETLAVLQIPNFQPVHLHTNKWVWKAYLYFH